MKQKSKWLLVCIAFIIAGFFLVGAITKPEEASFVTPHTYHHEPYKMHYVRSGVRDKPSLLFIHGTPGEWQAWSNYLVNTELLEDFNMMAVDRIGFGNTHYGQPVSSLKTHADAIALLLDKDKSGMGVMVIGHSYGAPIAAMIAATYPEKVSGLLLLAGTLNPAISKPRWYNYYTNWKLTGWTVPTLFRISNVEMMPLSNELEKLRPLWKDIKAPTIVIHGNRDWIAKKGNSEYAFEMLVNAAWKDARYYPKDGHFIIWKKSEVIVEAIFDMLEKVKAGRSE